MRIFKNFNFTYPILEILREIKKEIIDIKENQILLTNSIGTDDIDDKIEILINAVKLQTSALNNFLKINEQFVQNMTKYFNFELSQMEKMAGKEPHEKTEEEKMF